MSVIEQRAHDRRPATRTLRESDGSRVELVTHYDRRYGLPAFVPRAVRGPAVVWVGQAEAFADIAERRASEWTERRAGISDA